MSYEGVEPVHVERWPRYRARLDVHAKRIGRPFVHERHLYHDGYLVRQADGQVVVVSVAEFEAFYELSGRDD